MSSQLHHWLTEQEKTGAHDSEGSFSLRADRAWDKLGAFQLPFEEAWILKLVQAAVGMGATEVKVNQTWEETKLRFVDCRLQQADVEEAVFDMPQYLGPGYLHLGTAIRALAKGTEQAFSLNFGEERDQVWTGRQFVQRSWAGGRHYGDFSITVANFKRGDVSTTWGLSSAVLRKKVTDVFQTLCHRCYTSPIKLRVDGRMVNGLHSDPTFGLKKASRPLAVLEVPANTLPTLELIFGRDYSRCTASNMQVRLDLPQLPRCDDVVRAGVWLVMTAFLQGEAKMSSLALRAKGEAAQILWVCDGVIVERESLDFVGPLSFSILVSAKGLETDLTSLSLRKNSAYLERRQAALRGLGRMISKNRKSLYQTPVMVDNDDPLEQLLDRLDPVFKLVRPFVGDSYWCSKDLRSESRQQIELSVQSALRSVCNYLEPLAS